jgi:hypothetical protein
MNMSAAPFIYEVAPDFSRKHAVFSIATNGYEKTFEHCIRSQRDYCQRLGVPYFLVQGKPPWGINAHDSSWLKIPVMRHLQDQFSEGVLYLDADCEVSSQADDFRIWDKAEPEKSIFAALDFSNRLNAAVIYCRSSSAGKRSMSQFIWSSLVPETFIPRIDRNLYENGHFIWLFKDSPHVHVLPNEWNAGLYREMESPHIVHHGGTIMRESRGEQPLAWRSRLHAAWTGLRLPFHLAYFKRRLVLPMTSVCDM